MTSPSYAALALAGLASGWGPCVSSRYAAITSLCATRERSLPALSAFAGGVCAGYVALAFAAQDAAAILRGSAAGYAVFAGALAAAAVASLVRGSRCASSPPAWPASLPGVAAFGTASVAVASPCCTPIVAGLAAAHPSAAAPEIVALAAAFAAGHLMPLLLCAGAARAAGRSVARLAGPDTAATVSGGVLLGLAAYYAVLA